MGMENKLIPDYAITASSEVGLTILVIYLSIDIWPFLCKVDKVL